MINYTRKWVWLLTVVTLPVAEGLQVVQQPITTCPLASHDLQGSHVIVTFEVLSDHVTFLKDIDIFCVTRVYWSRLISGLMGKKSKLRHILRISQPSLPRKRFAGENQQ